MALLKQIDNLGATVCWSPFKESKSLLAVGSKGSNSFDDEGGEMLLVDVSTRHPGLKPAEVARVRAKSKFGSISWGRCASHRQGLIAGGMSSGHVEIYDPSNLNRPISSVQAHKDVVNCLAFNPHDSRSHILASGSSDGDVKIIDLSNPSNPQMCFPSSTDNDRHKGAVRSVQWNTKVDYIVASSSDDGSCIIWDLKRNKRWATLHAPRGSAFVDFAWHPSEGFQILTALADDSRPVVQVWDLRKSTTTPLGELRGHEKGLLSIDWSPQDPRLVVTSGQDNKTLMWDLQSGKSVYEVPQPESNKKVVETKQQLQEEDRKSPTGEGNFWENNTGGSQLTGAAVMSNARRITELTWSPHMPLVMAACTFDNKVEVFGMTTGACNTRRPPKWLGRRSGATFGFGGKLASVSSSNRSVDVRTVGSNSTVLKRTEEFEQVLAAGDLTSVCSKKSQSCSSSTRDAAVWDVMGILFDKDARRKLLGYLGFEPQKQQEEDMPAATTTTTQQQQQQQTPPPAATTTSTTTDFLAQSSSGIDNAEDLFGGSSGNYGGGGGDLFDAPAPSTSSQDRFSADDFFGEGPPLEAKEEKEEEVVEPPMTTMIPPAPPTRQELMPPPALHDTESDQQVKAAVMVGDFDLAVKKSLAKGNMADALLLAPFGSDDIFTRAREEYLRHQMRTRPFMRVILAILTKRLDLFVAESDLQKWRETLAVITSYAQQQEFASLCNALGDRILSVDPSDSNGSAVVCYMCAFNGAKACELWERRASELAKSDGSDSGLQELIERISVFQAALREVNQNDQGFQSRIVAHFTSHVTLLAEQGRPDLALQCAKRFQVSLGGVDADLNEMVNRLEAMAVKPVVQQQNVGQQQQNFGGQQQNFGGQQQYQQNFGGQQQQQNFGGQQQQQYQQQQYQQQYQQQQYPTATPVINQTPTQQQQQQQNASWSSFPAPTTTSKIPTDGFGTTDVPGGGTKYGNTSYLQHKQTPGATSGQMTQIFDPSKAATQMAAPQQQKQPARAPEPVVPKVLASELKPIVDSFQNAVSRIKVTPLSSTESRQLKLVLTSIKRLHDSLKNGQVDTATIQQLHVIANHINTNNYDYVKHYYDHLVNTAWKANRSWLKDLKWFVQLGKKKLQQ